VVRECDQVDGCGTGQQPDIGAGPQLRDQSRSDGPARGIPHMQDTAVRVGRFVAPGQPAIGRTVKFHAGRPDEDLLHHPRPFLCEESRRRR